MSRIKRLLIIGALCVGALVLVLFLEVGNLLALSVPIQAPDAIVSLASHEWERLPVAARLARDNPHAVVLLTTPVSRTARNCYQCDGRVNWLVRAGVKPQQIVTLAQKVRNTHDEAAATFSYAATRGMGSVLVVTSPYHGRRALAMFRHAFSGTPVRVGIQTALRESGAQPASWWLRPYDRWYVGYESAAIVMYALRYGVNPFVG